MNACRNAYMSTLLTLAWHGGQSELAWPREGFHEATWSNKGASEVLDWTWTSSQGASHPGLHEQWRSSKSMKECARIKAKTFLIFRNPWADALSLTFFRGASSYREGSESFCFGIEKVPSRPLKLYIVIWCYSGDPGVWGGQLWSRAKLKTQCCSFHPKLVPDCIMQDGCEATKVQTSGRWASFCKAFNSIYHDWTALINTSYTQLSDSFHWFSIKLPTFSFYPDSKNRGPQ